MPHEVRTFQIRSDRAAEDEAQLATFLRTVETHRIDTAFADGAWQILVLYQDMRKKEETAQIHSLLVAALSGWRSQAAARVGAAPDALLPDALLEDIARHAPTTEREVTAITGASGRKLGPHAAAVAQVVREALGDLIGTP